MKQVVLGFGQQDVSLMIFLHWLHSNVLLLVVVSQILYHCARNLEVCVLKAIKVPEKCAARDMVAEVQDVGTCGADRDKLRHRLFQYMEASRHYTRAHRSLSLATDKANVTGVSLAGTIVAPPIANVAIICAPHAATLIHVYTYM